MIREVRRLEQGPFDVLVVGGGVYGAWIAYDAALRGLTVAIVERRDWGAGASSASSKLIHGGLRYLEHLWLGLVRKTLAERARLIALAPHRVRPVRFLLPVYRGDRVGRVRLAIGLTLYDRLSGRRAAIAPHRSLDPAETRARCGFLSPRGLVGGFEYGDALTDDARFALEIVAGAVAAGAVAVNHAEATAWLGDARGVAGARVLDHESGARVDVSARVSVDATGAWRGRVDGATASPPVRLTKGVHLVLPALPAEVAVLLTARSDGRPIFLIPWYGRTLLGTTDTDFAGDPDAVGPREEDVRYLLSEANRALERMGWSDSDVLGSFAGLRTLRDEPAARPSSIRRDWSLAQPRDRLLASIGGKYTSARADAAIAVDRACAILGRPPGPCPTAGRPFPWSPAGSFEPWLEGAAREGEALGLDRETARAAAGRYGTSVGSLHRILREAPGLAARIDPALPFCLGEIAHAARHEMARTLEDVARRRIPLSILSRPSEAVLASIASVAGRELGWDPTRQISEARSLRPAPVGD